MAIAPFIHKGRTIDDASVSSLHFFFQDGVISAMLVGVTRPGLGGNPEKTASISQAQLLAILQAEGVPAAKFNRVLLAVGEAAAIDEWADK